MNVPACNLHSTAPTYDGLFTIGTGAAARTYELQPDGSAILFNRTVPGSMQPGGGGQNLAMADTQLLPAQNRKNVFAYADYDVNDNLNVFAQGMASWQTLRQIARVGDFLAGPPQQLTIFRNNAFLPSSVATIMDAAGVGSFVMTRNGHPEDWGRGSFANISRTQSATVGFKSTIASEGFFNGWSVDGYPQYGRNKLDAAQEGGIRLDRVYLATDAVLDTTTNTIRCNVTRVSGNVPDCVPLNVFGRGNASPEAVDWIKGYDPGEAVTVSPFIGFDTSGQPTYGEPWSYTSDAAKHRLITTTQKLAEVTASGNLFEGLGRPDQRRSGRALAQGVHRPEGEGFCGGQYRGGSHLPPGVVPTTGNDRCPLRGPGRSRYPPARHHRRARCAGQFLAEHRRHPVLERALHRGLLRREGAVHRDHGAADFRINPGCRI